MSDRLRCMNWRMAAACLLWLGVCMGLSGLHAAGAAVVEMRDGARHEGTPRLDRGRLLIKLASGPEVAIDLSALRSASFSDDAPAQPDAGAEPNATPGRVQGLRGEYHTPDFGELKLVRIDPKVDFHWGSGPPDPSVPEDFSVRWTGQVEPLHSETYTFNVEADDGARLWIDGKLLFNAWRAGPTSGFGSIDLQAGQRYDLRLEYFDAVQTASARLYWSSRQQAREIVPSSRLFPPSDGNPPTVRLIAPSQRILVNATQVTLEAEAADMDGAIRKVEFFVNNRPLGSATRPPWRYDWTGIAPGYYTLKVTATDDDGMSVTSPPAHVAVGGDGAGSLPAPWVEMTIGAREPIGSVRQARDTFTLTCAGGDLWGERDLFHYVYQPFNGDGTIIARVSRVEATEGTSAAAGLLIRENLAERNARVAFLGCAADGGVIFMRREHNWDRRKTAEDNGNAPCWLKLSRHGNLIKAYASEDGRSWQSLGERRVEMPADFFVGLAIASSGRHSARAEIDHVSVTAGSPQIESSVKGIMLRSGSIIAGNIHSADDTSIKLWRQGGEVVAPTSRVARILFRPLTSEAVERIGPGRTGAILGNGDFFDGAVQEIKNGHVTMKSVLFGVTRFNTWDEIVAAKLADIAAVPYDYDVTTVDGSLIRARSIEIDGDRLRIVDALDVVVPLRLDEVRQIRAMQ